MNPVEYFKKMSRFEQIWLSVFSITIVTATLIFSVDGTNWDNWFSIFINWIVAPVSALTGVITVVLVAKGSLHNYSFGIVNSLTYGMLAFLSGYYGDVIINWFFFLPTQFLIFFSWRKNLRTKATDIVNMKKLTIKQVLIMLGVGILLTYVYAVILINVDDWLLNQFKLDSSIYQTIEKMFGIFLLGALFDAASEILQLGAQILLIRRYAEQWILWILTNILSITMWISVIIIDPTTISWALSTLIMWIAFLINSFYGAYIWFSQSKGKSSLEIEQ